MTDATTTDVRTFWMEVALGLKAELVLRGNRIEQLEREIENAPPVDDIEWLIVRYFFQVERGQDARLDRVNAWLDKVKPLKEQP